MRKHAKTASGHVQSSAHSTKNCKTIQDVLTLNEYSKEQVYNLETNSYEHRTNSAKTKVK